MIVVKKITKTEDGYEASWILSTDQMNYLMTYAINDLLGRGLIEVDEVKATQDEEKAMQLELLGELDENQMEEQ